MSILDIFKKKEIQEQTEQEKEAAKFFDEMIEEKKKEKTIKNGLDLDFLERRSSVTASEFANFIKENALNTNIGIDISMFIETIKRELIIERGETEMKMKIDPARALLFKLDDDNEITMYYADATKNTVSEVYSEDKPSDEFISKLNKIYKEVNPESPIVKNYSYRKWDVSYLTETDDAKRKELINKNYNDLLDTGFFSESQAKLLAKAMVLNYDINCFANPLYEETYMVELIRSYETEKNKFAEQNLSEEDYKEKITKLEDKYKYMNHFCTRNFKYKFSAPEFYLIKTNAENGTLNKLANDPNLAAYFKFLYYTDQAITQMEPQKINLNNRVFVVKAVGRFATSTSELLTTDISLLEEIKGKDGKTYEKLLYKEQFPKMRPYGSLDEFYKAYSDKYNVKSSVELLNTYINEIRNGISDTTNSNNEIKLDLKDGTTLFIKGMWYSKSSDIDDIEPGVEIYHITSQNKRELIYSEDPRARILSGWDVVIRKAGGIITDERMQSGKDYNIEDEVLAKKEPTKIAPLSPDDFIKRFTKEALEKGSIVTKLPDGTILKFMQNNYRENGVVKQYCEIQKRNGDKYESLYKIKTSPRGPIVAGSMENVLKIVTKAMYKKNLDEILADETKATNAETKKKDVLSKDNKTTNIKNDENVK